MDYLCNYIDVLADIFKSILEDEKESLGKAADAIADAVKDKKLVHIMGTGAHSSMAGEEFFLRPGSLMNINPVFDPGLSVTHGAYRSWMIEKLTGYARPLLDYYIIRPGDVMILVNAYGINAISIDAAIESKKKGVTVIAITSPEFANAVERGFPSRHPGRKSLHELDEVDIVIDSHVPVGDCVIDIQGIEQKFGPVSTLCNSVVLGMLNAAAVKRIIDGGDSPDIIKSPYFTADGGENNERLIDKYYEVIKHI